MTWIGIGCFIKIVVWAILGVASLEQSGWKYGIFISSTVRTVAVSLSEAATMRASAECAKKNTLVVLGKFGRASCLDGQQKVGRSSIT